MILAFLDAARHEAANGDALPPLTLWQLLWGWLFGWLGWLVLPFQLWMLIYCIRHDPERYIWIWIILLLPVAGALLYFLARWLPNSRVEPPAFLNRWKKRNAIRRLEIAAAQIGNAHQHIQLGEALREIGRTDEAGRAYAQALAKEPENLAALWGAANVEYLQGEQAAVRDKLAKVIAVDPGYKFGDVSLLYAKALYALGEQDAARDHLIAHIRKWRQPEGLYLLAKIHVEQNNPSAAREQLQGLIVDVESSPRAIARKFLFWKGRAKRLLRKLPK